MYCALHIAFVSQNHYNSQIVYNSVLLPYNHRLSIHICTFSSCTIQFIISNHVCSHTAQHEYMNTFELSVFSQMQSCRNTLRLSEPASMVRHCLFSKKNYNALTATHIAANNIVQSFHLEVTVMKQVIVLTTIIHATVSGVKYNLQLARYAITQAKPLFVTKLQHR